MKSMKALISRFIRDEQGLETVEYAIIAGIVVTATITTIAAIGLWVSNKFDALHTALK